MELGRRDGRLSTKNSVRQSIPHPNFNLDQLKTIFAKHGLSQTDMIALSGVDKDRDNIMGYKLENNFLGGASCHL